MGLFQLAGIFFGAHCLCRILLGVKPSAQMYFFNGGWGRGVNSTVAILILTLATRLQTYIFYLSSSRFASLSKLYSAENITVLLPS